MDAQHRTHTRCPACATETPTLSPGSRLGSQQTGADCMLRGPCSTRSPDPSGQSRERLPRCPTPLQESHATLLSASFSLPQYCMPLTLSPSKIRSLVRGATASASGKVGLKGRRLLDDPEGFGPGGRVGIKHLQFPPGRAPAPLLGARRSSESCWLPALTRAQLSGQIKAATNLLAPPMGSLSGEGAWGWKGAHVKGEERKTWLIC